MEGCVTIGKIAIIGFGEVGVALASDLAARNDVAIAAYDLRFDDAASPPSLAIATASAERAISATSCVTQADLVISAVTAASAIDAASAAADALKAGAWWFDMNSASPSSKRSAAAIIDSAGGRYVEASVMAPINPQRMGAPILLGGPYAKEFEEIALGLGFSGAAFYAAEPGKTAAAKLCRSVVVKGMEALITESLLAAQHYGVEDEVIASLENLFPHPDWRRHAGYMISRTLEHGTRRAEEMLEASRTVADAGADPWMSNATVMRQAFAGSLGVRNKTRDLTEMLRVMRDGPATSNKDLEEAS